MCWFALFSARLANKDIHYWFFSGYTIALTCYSFYAPQLYRQVLLRRVLAIAILSVCPSIRPSVCLSRPGAETTEWERDSGSSPYDSLESLVSNEVIWCRWVRRFPSNEGGVPPLEIVILPLLAHLAWKRLQIESEFSLKYTGDRPILAAYEIKLMLWRVSWALAQISCFIQLIV